MADMPVLNVMENRMIFDILIAGVLLTLAVMDFIKKEVPLVLIILLACICVISRVSLGTNIMFLGLGVSVGSILIAISLMTKEKIGLGDGLIVTSLGLFLGVSRTVWMLFWASLIMTIVSVILLISGKRKIESRLPFIPALFIGFLIV